MGARKYYTEDFKRQLVELKRSGRAIGELSKEYKVTVTSIREWDRQITNSGTFGKTANESENEKELRQLRKENRQLRMEVDVLKQGTPHDNAVAESMYATIKTEFTFGREFSTLEEFKLHWFDYVNWYNNVRIHGSLDYMTPSEWHNLS